MADIYPIGRVYKIYHKTDTTLKCYIGSTKLSIRSRFYEHVCQYYNRKDNGHGRFTTAHLLFDMDEPNNFTIIELAQYENITRSDLLKEEGKYQRTHNCINKVINGSTDEEKHKKYKEAYNRWLSTEHGKKTSKEAVKRWEQSDRGKEKKKIIAKRRQKYINEYGKRKIKCECGATHRYNGKNRHLQTEKHKEWVKSTMEYKLEQMRLLKQRIQQIKIRHNII